MTKRTQDRLVAAAGWLAALLTSGALAATPAVSTVAAGQRPGTKLVTEAEWEKAARGARMGARYPWGDSVDGSKANCHGSGDPFENGSIYTTPCGHYNGSQIPAGVDMAYGYGLYDMAGNVLEWCWDWYSATYYGQADAGDNPRGPASGSYRMVRGGA